MIVLLTACLFLSGSLMFSYWLGRWRGVNMKAVGDGNPGAVNLWKAGGLKLGIAGLLLDFGKGYLPLLPLLDAGYGRGFALIPLALAPIAGHAFSPWLKGRGGKAIAVTFGVWSAMTAFEVSLAYAAILAIIKGLGRIRFKNNLGPAEADGIQVVSGMLLLLVYLLVRSSAVPVLWVWLGNFALLLYTHRAIVIRKRRR